MKKKFTRLQLATWGIFYAFMLLYSLQKIEQLALGFWSATIATFFYFLAAYCNTHWLIPRLYKKGKGLRYVLYSLLVLGVLVLARMFADHEILLPLHPGNFYGWTLLHFSFVFITTFLAFAFGALLRVSFDYLLLLRQQEEMKSRQLATELGLLKAQVQPHFLFNTLNNIYYLAYTKNERTAEVIAKLSEIMRYFVDEAPKEKLPLSTEIQFLENYIELEQIRMLHPFEIDMNVDADPALLISPMLLIPLVENIFKHGIDKLSTVNKVQITIRQLGGMIEVNTCNSIATSIKERADGQGLQNLRKRLEILFPHNFEMKIAEDQGHFKTSLRFPYEA